MSSLVYTKIYSAPPISEKEILRYAGASKDNCEIKQLIMSCLDEIQGDLSYKVCYSAFDIKLHNDHLDLGFCESYSSSMICNLKDCHKIVLFAATIGFGIDKIISKYSRISPTRALMFQAIGTERVESLCNAFNRDVKRASEDRGYFVRPRFSAGYGDCSLELQRDIIKSLDCQRKIGVTLNDSLMMNPTKSVTAIIGITKTKCNDIINNCQYCDMKDCIYNENN